MKFQQAIIIGFVATILSVVSSCQSDKSTVGGFLDLDTDLKIEFLVEADINPDESGVASPLFVRMYELKAEKIMKKADFIDIFERDKEVLGADLVGMHKLKPFRPGESRSELFVLNKNTKFVGLYAEFLDFKESSFKLVIPVVTNNVFKNSATVSVTGNELNLID
jgi:type VI secretion system protein VasD